MAVPIKKTFEIDFLSAKQIASRNVDNTPASRGAVLQADGKGNSAWLPNTTTATNAFSAITINSPITETLYADASTRLGNTLKIVSDGPIRLTGQEYSNRLTIGIDTTTFLTETTKRYPTEDFLSNTVIGSTYEIDCQYKTYFLEFAGRAITLSFKKANIPAGKLCTVRLFLKYNSALGNLPAGYSISWGAAHSVLFPTATPYSATAISGKTDILELTSADGGTTWYGVIQGLAC
jgi:hypothetical protein